MTGGNIWAPDAIAYQNAAGTLRLGGGLTTVELAALDAGKDRAMQQLKLAASLSLSGNTLWVTNLAGHKLITGYPEGRRMWLNVKWYDASGVRVREDGAYGPVTVTFRGAPTTVQTILDLNDPNTRIYQAHYAITQGWAALLVAIGYDPLLPVEYDRISGTLTYTLGEVAGQPSGTYRESFRFALNNHVARDNRIPPYGMSYDEAQQRNALPAPADQYGNPGPGGAYAHWDQVTLDPPGSAAYATVELLYQPTSWEYVQFLELANRGTSSFLALEGKNLYDAWAATGMARPYVMASAQWGTPPAPQCTAPGTPPGLTATAGRRSVTLGWSAASPQPATAYRVYYDQAGKLQLRASVSSTTLSYKDSNLSRGVQYCYRVTSLSDCNGNGVVDAGEESAPGPQACATAQ
jgi:hypothetical protein